MKQAQHPHNTPLSISLPVPAHSSPPKFKPTNESTIAQLNKVSIKEGRVQYDVRFPFRIRLPEYFNIPAFVDQELVGPQSDKNKGKEVGGNSGKDDADKDTKAGRKEGKVSIIHKQDIIFKKRIKDLQVLAQGMKRSKNIKQQSRYYFTQAVLYNNIQQYQKSIQLLEKFLKIVLYLKDEKSAQLVFNAIGCAYMQMGNYKKAEEFHGRQTMGPRADRVVGAINVGLCREMVGDFKAAVGMYREAEMLLQDEQNRQQQQKRRQLVHKLLQRTPNQIQPDLFMTQNKSPKASRSSPNKSIQSTLLKEESILMLKNSQNRKQFEENKLKYAIYAAQENIDDYVKGKIGNQ